MNAVQHAILLTLQQLEREHGLNFRIVGPEYSDAFKQEFWEFSADSLGIGGTIFPTDANFWGCGIDERFEIYSYRSASEMATDFAKALSGYLNRADTR